MSIILYVIFLLILGTIVITIKSKSGYAKMDGVYIDGIKDLPQGLHINLSFSPKKVAITDLEIPIERIENIKLVSNTYLTEEQSKIVINDSKATEVIVVIEYVNIENESKECLISLKDKNAKSLVQDIINRFNSNNGIENKSETKQI